MKQVFELHPISEEEVKTRGIKLENLWLVNYESNILGPYDEVELKNYALENPDMFQDISVCSIESEIWYEYFKCSIFQRRKPQLLSQEDFLHNEEYHYIISGQKQGPVSFEKLKDLMDDDILCSTDSITNNEGVTWVKIYQHPNFDRRDFSHSHSLPSSPATPYDQMTLLEDEYSTDMDTDLIAGIAFIGNKGSKGQELLDENSYCYDHSTTDWNKLFKSKVVTFSAAFAIVVTLLFVFMSGKSDYSKDATVTRRIASKSASKSAKKKNHIKKVAEKASYKAKNTSQGFKRKVTKRSPVRSKSKRIYRPKPKRKVASKKRDKSPVFKPPINDREPDNYNDSYKDEYKDEYPADERDAETVINELANEDSFHNENDPIDFAEQNDY